MLRRDFRTIADNVARFPEFLPGLFPLDT